VIESEKNTCVKDYENMIKDFRNLETRMKLKQNNSKKVRTLNAKWKKKIIEIKDNKFQSLVSKRDAQNEIIMKKSEQTENILKENKEKRLTTLREIQEKNQSAFDSLHDKIETILYENENERLEIEENINERIKKLSMKNKQTLEKKHIEFEKKLAKSFQIFKTKYSTVIQSIDEKLKINMEKPIEKYEKWV
jgi:hypothetical protein